MEFYIYRNFTVENLFKDLDAEYSGYGDISFVPENCNSYIWFYLPSINMNYQELSQEVQDFQIRFEILLNLSYIIAILITYNNFINYISNVQK